MKGYYLILFIALFAVSAKAQINEGFFQYNIDVTAIDTSLETKRSVSMLRNSKMTIFFDQNNYTKVIFKMGMLFTSSIILDHKTNKSLTLSKSMMGNHAIKSKIDPNISTVDTSIIIELIDEEKMILGFKCKKAILSNRQNPQKLTYWYTNDFDIKLYNTAFINPNIPGFPLAFSTVDKGVFMEYQASNHSFKLEDKERIFSFEIPEGYKVTEQ